MYHVNFISILKLLSFMESHSAFVMGAILASYPEFCNCDASDDWENEKDFSGLIGIRSIYVGLLLGIVFIIMISFAACCFFCPCSFCFLSRLRARNSDEARRGLSEVERTPSSSSNDISQFSTTGERMAVSSIVIVCENQNGNRSRGRNVNIPIPDPPPPYPGRSSRNNLCLSVEEYPPPYSPSFSILKKN